MKVIIHEQNELKEGWFDALKTGAQTMAGDVKNYAGKIKQAGQEGSLKADVPKALNSISAQLTKAAQDIQSLRERSAKLGIDIGDVKNILYALNTANNKIKNSEILVSKQLGGQEAQPSQQAKDQAMIDDLVARRRARIAADQQANEPEVAASPNAAAERPEADADQGNPKVERINPKTNQVFDNLKGEIATAFRNNMSKSFKGTDEATILQIYKQHINDALNQKSLDSLDNLTDALNIRSAAKQLVSQFINNDQQELEESNFKPKFKIKIC
jgi:hypothetical protein